VDAYSGIPLSEKARDELRRNALPSKNAQRVLGLMADGPSAANGGVFFESSVPNMKAFLNESDITQFLPNISSLRPVLAPVGSIKIRIEFDGGRFETVVPVLKEHLTKVVVTPTGVFAEKPIPVQTLLK
jgi:hypothetical protein